MQMISNIFSLYIECNCYFPFTRWSITHRFEMLQRSCGDCLGGDPYSGMELGDIGSFVLEGNTLTLPENNQIL